MTTITATWRTVPRDYRSTLRALINSEQDADRKKAQAECLEYGIDYNFARMVILQEMIEDGCALMERQTRGESKAERYRPTEGVNG
jgi:hypothetical protein